jgi:PAS domain S-box-containing protein
VLNKIIFEASHTSLGELLVVLLIFFLTITLLLLFFERKKRKKSSFSDYIINNGNSIVIASNSHGEVTFVSDNVREILGYTPAELLGTGWWEKTLDEKTVLENNKEEIILKLNQEQIYTRLIKTKKGEFKWIQWHDKKFNDKLIVGIGQDVTKIKELEKNQTAFLEKQLIQQNILNKINNEQKTGSLDLEELINFVLKKASDGIEIDIISFLKYEPGKLVIESIYNKNTNVFSFKEELNFIDYPAYFSRLLSGQIINAEDVYSNEFTKEFIISNFTEHKIISLLNVPIFIGGELNYVISCETTTKKKLWDEEDINFIKSLANFIIFNIENADKILAQKRVEENESIFRQINETIESVFWLYSQEENRVIYISPSSEKILGVSSIKFIETNDYWKHYILKEDKEKIIEAHKKLNTKGTYEVEYRIKIDGQIRWIKEKSYVVSKGEKGVIKNCGICTDITEEKIRNQELKQLSLIAQNTNNAIAISDIEGNVLWVNQSYMDLFEIEFQEIKNKKPREVFIKDKDALVEKINELNGTNYKTELNLEIKKGKSIWIEINNTVFETENGDFQQVEIISDITKRIEADKQIESQALILEEYSRELEFQNTLKEKLLLAQSLNDVSYNYLNFISDQIDQIAYCSISFPDFYEQIFSGFSIDYEKQFKQVEFYRRDLDFYQKIRTGNLYIVDDLTKKEETSELEKIMLEKDVQSYMVFPLFYNNQFLGFSILQFFRTLNLSSKQIADLKDTCKIVSVAVHQIKLNEALQQKNEDILSSITYAKNIQNSIFTEIKKFSEHFDNVALFYRPKDIVSGDFYWSKETENYSLVAIGDCTGHGVPGAFLTLLGINLLEQIIGIEKNYNPANVLAKMNLRLNAILNRNENNNSIEDGMELGLCMYDKKENRICYAGAGLGILYFLEEQEHHVRGERATIGENLYKDFTFTNNFINLTGKEYFFMSTDGYQDQIGGEKNKRFSKKNLISLLNKNKALPSIEQENRLKSTIDEYIGSKYQLDDLTVLGFKIKNK